LRNTKEKGVVGNLLLSLSNSKGKSKGKTTLMFREKCAGTVKAKPGEEELLEAFWKANYYVAGMI
jgi:hypothetical protein